MRLLDTGCDISILPEKWIGNRHLRPSDRKIFAANQTEVEVLGELDVDLRIGGEKFQFPMLVSDQVTEVMLSYGWLHHYEVIWEFKTKLVEINGRNYMTMDREEVGWVRKLTVERDTTIPPRSEALVNGMMVYRTFKPLPGTLLTESVEVKPKVRVVRELLPDRNRNIPVRVVNMGDDEVLLPKGMGLSEVQPVETFESQLDGCKEFDHLKAVLGTVDDELYCAQRVALETLLKNYASTFSKDDMDLGRATGVKHSIDTNSHRPVKQALRRQPEKNLSEIDNQVETMLKQSIIEPAQSAWSSNVVMARKKDGSLRFCVDYRKLNELTVKDTYPLPLIQSCLDAVGKAKWFSTFDLRSGYHQVVMEQKDADKTTFVTRRGTYRFRVMPFGLCNAPATFQRLMDVAMSGLNLEICLVYLDDIILFSDTVEQHMERLEQLFQRLDQTNLKLKPSKCKLFQREVLFLGHRLSADGLTTDPEKTRTIQEWPTPKNLKEVRSFLGLCSYYRRFVQGFSEIASPLHELTKKNHRFGWTTECEDSFKLLKEKLVSSPILAMPVDDGQYFLDTDACDVGIGAVLSQEQNGCERVIAYASRSLSKSERNYCATRKELLAVVFFLKQYRCYLLGRHIKIRTDHAALRWLKNTPEPIGQQARWLEIMEEYDYEIIHRAGRLHQNADALSRYPCKQCGAVEDVIEEKTSTACKIQMGPEGEDQEDEWASPGMATKQKEDLEIKTFYSWKESQESPPTSDVLTRFDEKTKIYARQWDRIQLRNGVLYRRFENPDGTIKYWQLIPPIKDRERLIRLCHTGVTGGHLGFDKTKEQVQRRMYWPGWTKVGAR